MPDFLAQLLDVVRQILPGAAGAGALKGAQLLFRYRNDIPVCNTRIMREGRGLPWNRRVALHPLKNGRLEITVVQMPKEK